MSGNTRKRIERLYLPLTIAIALSVGSVLGALGADTSRSEEAAWALLSQSKDPEIVALRTLISSSQRLPASNLQLSPSPKEHLRQHSIQRLEQRIAQLERELRLMRGDIARLKRGL